MPQRTHDMSDYSLLKGGEITVADGKHTVPPGIAVEELDGGKKKLAEKCPPYVQELLESKGLMGVYDKLVKTVVEESRTRTTFGGWKDMEFDSIISVFRDEFAEGGVKVALCKRKSGGGTYRWLEFIDIEAAGTYVPQFDVHNMSGQVIKTCYTKVEFPNGVAVEKFNRHGKARKKLKERMPIYVETMMKDKDLMDEYNALIDQLCGTEKGWGDNWKTSLVNGIVQEHAGKFEKKGVSLFLAMKVEYISHGQHGGHNEYFRWLEFVDREQQPNYIPQRGTDERTEGKKECVIS